MEIISRILQKKLQTSFEDLWEARQERHTFNDIDALKNISLKCIEITEALIKGKIEFYQRGFQQVPSPEDEKRRKDVEAMKIFLANLGKVKPQISEEKEINKLKDYVKDAVDMCGKSIYGKDEFEKLYGKTRKTGIRQAKKN